MLVSLPKRGAPENRAISFLGVRIAVRLRPRAGGTIPCMGRSVLIVDDHPGFRSHARRFLEREGYEVVAEAGGVAEALTRARESEPELALVDIGLPDGNGYDLTGELLELPRPPAVVLISSHGEAEVSPCVAGSGALGFIPKDELSGERIEALLGESAPAPADGAAPMRVLVADDSVLLRAGIVRLLADAGFEVVAEAGDAEELLRKAAAHKPDVAIVDIRMPPDGTDDGLRAALEIRRRLPRTGVLVLSQYVEEGYALDLLGESAERTGYLLKDRVADVERFLDSVRRVGQGGSALDPEVVAHMLGRRRDEDPLAELTAREREVLALMAEGRSNAAAAEQLVVTERAVEKHVTSIFGKLGLAPAAEDHRRVLAVLTFLRSR
jgi:DNA-binding NarL/FixJ family response regulator